MHRALFRPCTMAASWDWPTLGTAPGPPRPVSRPGRLSGAEAMLTHGLSKAVRDTDTAKTSQIHHQGLRDGTNPQGYPEGHSAGHAVPSGLTHTPQRVPVCAARCKAGGARTDGGREPGPPPHPGPTLQSGRRAPPMCSRGVQGSDQCPPSTGWYCGTQGPARPSPLVPLTTLGPQEVGSHARTLRSPGGSAGRSLRLAEAATATSVPTKT